MRFQKNIFRKKKTQSYRVSKILKKRCRLLGVTHSSEPSSYRDIRYDQNDYVIFITSIISDSSALSDSDYDENTHIFQDLGEAYQNVLND